MECGGGGREREGEGRVRGSRRWGLEGEEGKGKREGERKRERSRNFYTENAFDFPNTLNISHLQNKHFHNAFKVIHTLLHLVKHRVSYCINLTVL